MAASDRVPVNRHRTSTPIHSRGTRQIVNRRSNFAGRMTVELINSKRAGKPVTAKARPRGENVVDLMDALRQSIGKASSPPAKPDKKTRKASAGQKEMLMPIQGKKGAKETTAKKPASRQRKSA